MSLFKKKVAESSAPHGMTYTPGEDPTFDIAFARFNRLLPLIRSVLDQHARGLGKYGSFQVVQGNPVNMILNGSPHSGGFFELVVRLRRDEDASSQRRSQGLRTSQSDHYLGVMNYTTFKERFLLLDEVNEVILSRTVSEVLQDQMGKFATGVDSHTQAMRDRTMRDAGYWINEQNKRKR